MTYVTGKTVYCLWCGKGFQARFADLNRGWAKYCSKSCKAKAQAQGEKNVKKD